MSQQNGKQILQGQESRQPLAFPKSHKPEKKTTIQSPHPTETKQNKVVHTDYFPAEQAGLAHTCLDRPKAGLMLV